MKIWGCTKNFPRWSCTKDWLYMRWSYTRDFTVFFVGQSWYIFVCSAPAMALADACTLSSLEGAPTENYGKQRMFGSVGWGLAMFFVGIALDNAKAFPDHPCSRVSLQEKNYMLCFAVFSVLMTCALLISTQIRFPSSAERPDLVPQAIMDSQIQKVDPVKAENVRARAPEPVESVTGPAWFGVFKVLWHQTSGFMTNCLRNPS